MSTLMERIGDDAALDGVIARFHQKLIADPVTAPFFEGINIEKLHEKQHLFLTMVFCGKSDGVAYYMRESHATLVRDMGLSDIHYDRTIQLLEESLREADLGEDLVRDVIELTWTLKDSILGRDVPTL